MKYSEQIKSPKWQKKRLEVLNLRGFKCEKCGCEEKQLHVHHRFYISGRLIHEYDNDVLQVLCEDCHKKEHSKEQSSDVIQNKYSDLIAEIDSHKQIHKKDIINDLCYIISCINRYDDEQYFITELSEAFNSNFYRKISIELAQNSSICRTEYRLFILEQQIKNNGE